MALISGKSGMPASEPNDNNCSSHLKGRQYSLIANYRAELSIHAEKEPDREKRKQDATCYTGPNAAF